MKRRDLSYYLTSMNWFYARYYFGQFLLVVPIAIAFLTAGFGKNLGFLWMVPSFGGIGWFTLLTLHYGFIRPSKKQVALHLLYAGLCAGLYQCSVLIFLKLFDLECQAPKSLTHSSIRLNLGQNPNHLQSEEAQIPPSRELKGEGGL